MLFSKNYWWRSACLCSILTYLCGTIFQLNLLLPEILIYYHSGSPIISSYLILCFHHKILLSISDIIAALLSRPHSHESGMIVKFHCVYVLQFRYDNCKYFYISATVENHIFAACYLHPWSWTRAKKKNYELLVQRFVEKIFLEFFVCLDIFDLEIFQHITKILILCWICKWHISELESLRISNFLTSSSSYCHFSTYLKPD